MAEVKIIESVRDNMKTLVAGCVSSGKTHATAGLLFWWLAAFFPARVFCLAPTERQLKINLWGEVPRIYRTAPIKLGGDMMPLSLQYRLSEDWFALGFSPQDEQGVFGIHGPHDLLVIDDAQGVKQEIWGALENALAGGATHVLASCNPIVTSGEIFNALTKNRGEYNIIRISADKNDRESEHLFIAPNIKARSIVVPGTVTQIMVDKWTTKFGWDSDFVRTKVRAMLPKQEPDTLIPLDWIEAAQNRDIPAGGHITTMGVDVARFGDDETVLFLTRGRQGLEPIVIQGNDTMQVAGRIVRAITDFHVRELYIDVIGIGAGVYDRLNEIQKGNDPNAHIPKHVSLVPVNVGEKAKDEKNFVNLRSEIWWAARESLDPKGEAPMALPHSDELMAELAAPKYSIADSGGRIKVESKDDMKERIGRSPDLADAYCLAVFKRYQGKTRPAVVAFTGAMPGAPRTADWM